MGLDMYLSKKTYVKNWSHMAPEELHEITVKIGGKIHPTIKPERISYITEQIAYWRKANAIHDWFVKNVQDGRDECQESSLSLAQLQELYDACVIVRDNCKLADGQIKNGYTVEVTEDKIIEKPIMEPGKYIVDPSVAADILPTAAGFFFGSTDYDQYYLQDILDTIEMIEPELKIKYEKAWDEPEYTYRASW